MASGSSLYSTDSSMKKGKGSIISEQDSGTNQKNPTSVTQAMHKLRAKLSGSGKESDAAELEEKKRAKEEKKRAKEVEKKRREDEAERLGLGDRTKLGMIGAGGWSV
jgi:hypothetical protein